MRKSISPATVIASVALFFSLAGAGMAASGYLVTSVRQIAPSVRHALRGARGRAGVRGRVGARGVNGQQGSFGWRSTYYRISAATGEGVLTSSSPNVTIVQACDLGDHVITGGYDGYNEIVTEDLPLLPSGWMITAHLDPNAPAPEGYAKAWVLCARSS